MSKAHQNAHFLNPKHETTQRFHDLFLGTANSQFGTCLQSLMKPHDFSIKNVIQINFVIICPDHVFRSF